jgi:hypothetical protein
MKIQHSPQYRGRFEQTYRWQILGAVLRVYEVSSTEWRHRVASGSGWVEGLALIDSTPTSLPHVFISTSGLDLSERQQSDHAHTFKYVATGAGKIATPVTDIVYPCRPSDSKTRFEAVPQAMMRLEQPFHAMRSSCSHCCWRF